MKKYAAVLLACLLLSACGMEPELPAVSLPGNGISIPGSNGVPEADTSPSVPGDASRKPTEAETILPDVYSEPDGTKRDVYLLRDKKEHTLTCTLAAEDGSPAGSWTVAYWMNRITEQQGMEKRTEQELLCLSRDYLNALQKEAAQEDLTAVQKESILAEINQVLNGYRDGSLPGEYVFNSDSTTFTGGIPADSSLPDKFEWENLDICLDDDNGLYGCAFDASVPLENDYLFQVWGWADDSASTEWTVGMGNISDQRESQSFAKLETDKGTFSHVSHNRLTTLAGVTNLVLPGFPTENSGQICLNRATGDVSLSLDFPDGTWYVGFTQEHERNPNAWAPPLSPEEEKKSLALCHDILDEALASAQES